MLRTLLISLFLVPGQAPAQDFQRHVIAVIDNSGTVYDNDGYEDFTRFYRARLSFVEFLGAEYSREDYITLISVSRPGVIWSGAGTEIDRKRRAPQVFAYLDTPHGGCAGFDAVLEVVNQQIAEVRLPLSHIYFFSSLVESGPYPCATLSQQTPPFWPENTFYDGLNKILADTATDLDFWWVDEGSYNQTFDQFADDLRRVNVKNINETILEMRQ